MSIQSWQETRGVALADGTAHANSTTETLLYPTFVIPADTFDRVGKTFRLTLKGKFNNIATTPGTLLFALRWNGVAGTMLAQSEAIALNISAQTAIMFKLELHVVCRAVGSVGTLLAMGMAMLAAQLAANIGQQHFMGSAGGGSGDTPAPVTIDLTAAGGFSVTADWSVADAGNSITAMQMIVEELN